jgi:N-hydroxyarylamine O-acetyltransferase
MFELGAYLDRIGLSREPSIAAVHRAHATAIPFENLDPRSGVPVSLALDDLARKLVDERRGGYCFEQNLLLAAALRELGAEVELMLARVRSGAPPGTLRPRSHLVLRVRADGADLHADVGFGLGTLLEPIPFGPGGEHDQEGWRFRIREDGAEYVLQLRTDAGWADQYAFVPESAPQIDVEVQNWFTCTHPRSPFVTGLVASVYRPDATRVTLSDWGGELTLSEQSPTARTDRSVAPADVRRLLADEFGLEAPATLPPSGRHPDQTGTGVSELR